MPREPQRLPLRTLVKPRLLPKPHKARLALMQLLPLKARLMQRPRRMVPRQLPQMPLIL